MSDDMKRADEASTKASSAISLLETWAGSVSKPEIKEGPPTCKFRPAWHNWMQQNAPKNLYNGASSRCAELSETVPECNNYSPVHEWVKENPPPSLVRLHNPPRPVRLRRSQIIIARNARNSD